MRIIATMPAKNEAWIIGASVRVALQWCDAIVILDHHSTDDTPDIIRELQQGYGARIIPTDGADAAWNEATFRQQMLDRARANGATHIAMIDADEMLTANLIPTIRQMAKALQPRQCLKLPWIQAWRSLGEYRADESIFGRARVPCLFRDAPNVAFKPKSGDYQIHTRIPHPTEIVHELRREDGGVMHFQHANWGALLAKQACYKMTERVRWPHIPVKEIDDRYNGTVNEDGLQVQPIPDEWVAYRAAVPRVNVDRVPWQAAECRRLWESHGAERFEGLDLFGVVP